MNGEHRFAVIGAGGFARFAVTQFVKCERARLVGAFDSDPAAIEHLRAIAPGIRAYQSADQLLSDPAIDLVYIGSPPSLHHEQSMAALRAGKHVICEKPAALEARQAQALKDVAERSDLLFVVNLMQRYNPLYAAVKALVDAQVLGAVVHGFFENYASDEFLPPDHWFWDERKSGGIFIEHGVHFFDMFAGWLGRGELIAAQKLSRPGHPGVWDIAQCTVLYPANVPVHYFHGFNQPKMLDRQQMRLQFERGDITLHEWVPTRLVLDAVCTNEELSQLKAIFPAAEIEVLSASSSLKTAQGRFKPVRFHQRIRLDTGSAQSKAEVYEGILRDMFSDQLRWLDNRSAPRRIDAGNAVDSVAMAEQAEKSALRF
jgi:predicted dehydrogenase